MSYFSEFPNVAYKFGDEPTSTLTPNLLAYADILDDIKDNIDFYQNYVIQDERPDQLSYKLYDDPSFYWTFFNMNDNLRRQGWPLSRIGVEETAKKVFKNTTVTTRGTINADFGVGVTVSGVTSGQSGTVVRRNLDLGQIIVDGTVNFINGELLKCQVTGSEVVIQSAVPEYNSVKHYVNGDGEMTDIDPTQGPGSEVTPVTYLDFYDDENEKLRTIKVIKPEAMNSVISVFNEAIRAV
jgi:hypothetical protein